MKNLHGENGSVVSLSHKFIFNGLGETIESIISPSIDSWEEAGRALDDLFPNGEAPEAAKQALQGLEKSVDFENSDEDTDPRSETMGSLSGLHNAIVGAYPTIDADDLNGFIDNLRDFYEPLVRQIEAKAVIDADRSEMASLADSIMAHAADQMPNKPEQMTVAEAQEATPADVEKVLAQIENIPTKVASQPVLTVATKVADLNAVLQNTEAEMRERGFNPDNFAPDLFA